MKIVKGLSVVTLILFMCGLFYVADEPVEVSALDKPVKKLSRCLRWRIIMMRLLSQQ